MEEQRQGKPAVARRAVAERDLGHQQRVLRDREDVVAMRLPVPARDAREPVGDVLDLDVERRRVEKIEPAPRQHALPRPRTPGRGGAALPPRRRHVP